MKKHRALVYLYCAVLVWIIVDIYFMEMRKRGELVAFCDYAALGEKEIKLSKPAPAARAAVRWIAAAAGVAPNFEIYEGDDVPNVAFASVMHGKRIIVYDAKRFQWGENTARWVDVCILAHEVGHHLGTHPFLAPKPHDAETEADHFSGYACALLGANLAQALSMTSLFPDAESQSHPGKDERRTTIAGGWSRGETLKRTGKVGMPREGFTP